MMEAVYRCSLCGTRYAEGKTSSVLAEAYLQTLLASGEESASLIGYTGRVYRKTVHRCPDGAFGIGEIIGFRPEEKKDGCEKDMPQVRERI